MAKKDEPTLEDLGLEPQSLGGAAPEAPNENPTDPPAGTAPRKRGRPAGSGKTTGEGPKKSPGRKAEDSEALAKQIMGLHMMAAMATGIGEIAISEGESQMLAKGITAVAEEYGLAVTGKAGAALQLFGAAAIVYVPRMLIVKAKADEARRAAQANQPTDVEARYVSPGH